MKDEFLYKIYTYDNKGRWQMMCKTDNPNSANYIMSALCEHYPNWTFELWHGTGNSRMTLISERKPNEKAEKE